MKLLMLFLVGAIALSLSGCSSEAPPAPDEVTGLIVTMTPESLGGETVESFVLEEGDETYEIEIDPDRDYGFDLGHLYEHHTDALPVKVELEDRDGTLVATAIEDV